MKKYLLRLLLIAAAAFLILFPYDTRTAAAAAESEKAEWTVLVYLCGSDLESKYSYATRNLQEIMTVDYPYDYLPVYTQEVTDLSDMIRESGGVNVLIETGGTKNWHASDIGMNISPDALQRWKLYYDPREMNETGERIGLQETLPLRSMADPQTLTDFIRWGTEQYPANKYALVIWGHGNGAKTGVCIDELFDGDILRLDELSQALADGGTRMEALIFDACLMANIETARAVKDHARWMIASQENVPGEGTAVGDWLQALVNHPVQDGEWLGRCVCDMTGIKYANEADDMSKSLLTWSVIDLSRIDRLVSAFDRFFREVGDAFRNRPILATVFAQYIFDTPEFGDGTESMRDLGSLFYNPGIIHYLDSGFLDEAVDALAETVAYIARGAGRSDARGISFCYPADFTEKELDIYAGNYRVPAYLAYLDAISEWTAPDWVYAETEKLPYIDTVSELRVSARKARTDSGMPALDFGSTEENVGYIFYNLYRLNETTDKIEWLGRRDCSPVMTEEGPVWCPDQPMNWPAINGAPCCIDLVQLSDTRYLYNIPVQINSEYAILRCGRTVEKADNDDAVLSSYEIYGVWEGYEENSTLLNRGVIPLAMMSGRLFRLLYPIGVPEITEESDFGASEEMKILRHLDVEETLLPAGTYYLEFELWDIFMRMMRLEKIPFTWDGREISIGDDFSWEGTVLPAWNR